MGSGLVGTGAPRLTVHVRIVARRILIKIHAMRDDLAGDVKRLTNMAPAYRLRVGDYRVLFEVERERIIVYRVRHRREAYKR